LRNDQPSAPESTVEIWEKNRVLGTIWVKLQNEMVKGLFWPILLFFLPHFIAKLNYFLYFTHALMIQVDIGGHPPFPTGSK
jgi:hypothetical protein